MNKSIVLIISLLLIFNNITEAAVYKRQDRSLHIRETVALSRFSPLLMENAAVEREVAGLNRAKDSLQDDKEEDSLELSSGDIELLARLVHAEAKGEPFQGKVGVAATVLNRLKSPQYPDTVHGVVFQQNQGFQYCPVRNGQINIPADETAFRAVREAMAGKDPTGGALSFYNPAKTWNSWIRSRLFCRQIGDHVFVK